MSTTQQTADVAHPTIKIVTAWGMVGITSWADFASALAATYTIILITEWLWKKCLRPFAEDRGWIKRKLRRREDRDA